MYMSCTCLTIMYMLLTISFSISLPSFLPTMYMFVQNSKKKISLAISTLHFGGFLTISYREIGVKRKKN